MNQIQLHKKTQEITAACLAQKQFICAVDLLLGLGYLSPTLLND